MRELVAYGLIGLIIAFTIILIVHFQLKRRKALRAAYGPPRKPRKNG